MYQAVFRRKELKYLMDDAQARAFSNVILKYMLPDEYPKSAISNLYYDTPDFRLIRNSLAKPSYKEKLRLRCYSTPGPDTEAFLEIKKKVLGTTYKRRVELPYARALSYMAGRAAGWEGQIFRELDWMRQAYEPLAPVMYLSYDRCSFKGAEDPSLRLTVDRNIRWRTQQLDLSRGAWGEQLLEPGQWLMEIKITGAMPLWLADSLSELELYPVSFSKYGRAYQTMLFRQLYWEEVKQYA